MNESITITSVDVDIKRRRCMDIKYHVMVYPLKSGAVIGLKVVLLAMYQFMLFLGEKMQFEL